MLRIPEEWLDGVDVDRLGAQAAFLHLATLAWSNRAGADGFIPTSRAARITALAEPEALIERLVEVGLWERVDGGYQITTRRGLLQYQNTREATDNARAKSAERQARHRERLRNAVTNAATEDVTNAVSDAATRVRGTRPYPSLPGTTPSSLRSSERTSRTRAREKAPRRDDDQQSLKAIDGIGDPALEYEFRDETWKHA